MIATFSRLSTNRRAGRRSWVLSESLRYQFGNQDGASFAIGSLQRIAQNDAGTAGQWRAFEDVN
jgi:hypothetical protein